MNIVGEDESVVCTAIQIAFNNLSNSSSLCVVSVQINPCLALKTPGQLHDNAINSLEICKEITAS